MAFTALSLVLLLVLLLVFHCLGVKDKTDLFYDVGLLVGDIRAHMIEEGEQGALCEEVMKSFHEYILDFVYSRDCLDASELIAWEYEFRVRFQVASMTEVVDGNIISVNLSCEVSTWLFSNVKQLSEFSTFNGVVKSRVGKSIPYMALYYVADLVKRCPASISAEELDGINDIQIVLEKYNKEYIHSYDVFLYMTTMLDRHVEAAFHAALFQITLFKLRLSAQQGAFDDQELVSYNNQLIRLGRALLGDRGFYDTVNENSIRRLSLESNLHFEICGLLDNNQVSIVTYCKRFQNVQVTSAVFPCQAYHPCRYTDKL